MRSRFLVISFALFLVGCDTSDVESIPDAYATASEIWSDESEVEEFELMINGLSARIYANPATSSGTTIHFSDEQDSRDIFPQELYFGATEIKYDDQSAIIYIKVAGAYAAGGPSGSRIFEYDAGARKPLRDYWVEERG